MRARALVSLFRGFFFSFSSSPGDFLFRFPRSIRRAAVAVARAAVALARAAVAVARAGARVGRAGGGQFLAGMQWHLRAPSSGKCWNLGPIYDPSVGNVRPSRRVLSSQLNLRCIYDRIMVVSFLVLLLLISSCFYLLILFSHLLSGSVWFLWVVVAEMFPVFTSHECHWSRRLFCGFFPSAIFIYFPQRWFNQPKLFHFIF